MKRLTWLSNRIFVRVLLGVAVVGLCVFGVLGHKASQRTIGIYLTNDSPSPLFIKSVTIGNSTSLFNRKLSPSVKYTNDSRFSMKDDWLSQAVEVDIDGGSRLKCIAKNKNYFDHCFLKIGVLEQKELQCSCDNGIEDF